MSTSGQIQTKEGVTYDYEGTKSSYSVTVKADDKNGGTDTIDVTINVADENDAPTFADGTLTFSIPENSPADTSVGSPVTATDEDTGDSQTYTLEGTDKDSFKILGTGQIQTKADVTYNYEAKSSYSVAVKADDSNGGTATKPVTIDLTDENEPPAFDGPTTTREVAENTATNTPFGDEVEATDPDDGDTLIYSLGGTDSADFDIDTSTGQLKTRSPLDKETEDTYEVTVSVKDRQTDTNPDATIDVTITVIDANDAPTFAAGTLTFSIPENSPADTDVGSPVTATDTDTGDSLTHTLEGTDKDSFKIVAGTGQIQTKADVTYNYEAKSTYSVTVKAEDTGGGTATKPVTINLTNVNEKPEFDEGEDDTLSIPENTAGGQAISYPVTATDPEGDNLTYTLSGTDATSFTIDGSTGQIRLGAGVTLDHETDDTYEVTVSVTDSKDDAGETEDTPTVDDTIAVTITVTDANDAPTFAAGTLTFSIPENSPEDTNVGSPVTATDTDTGDSLTHTLEGTDKDSFKIVSTSGQIQTKADVTYNYEAKSSYSVTVKADDSKGGTATKPVTINLTNVNEKPEFDEGATAARSIVENITDGMAIGAPVNATDPESDSLTYTLGGTDAASFTIDDGTGQIKLATGITLDHETKPSYSVTVSVKDDKDANGDAATTEAADDSITVTINVTGANEAPTVSGDTTKDYAENGDGDVATYTASDPETQSIIWSLGGDDGALFTITGGVLKFRASPNFEDPADKDTSNDYEVTVIASDGHLSDELAVTVTVTNVEELGKVTFSSIQPQAQTGLVATLTDPDIIKTYDTWKWEKSGNNIWAVISGATDGTYVPLDNDVGSHLRVTVTYTDTLGSGKTATATTTNRVQAAPQSNVAPVFATATAQRTIAENTTAGQNIGAPVTATDDDTDPLTYSLEGTDAASFSIVPETGQLQTRAALDFEDKNSYTVTVKAKDPSLDSDTITVTITVTNVDENPVFADDSVSRNVDENTQRGENVGPPVTATDQDTNDTLAYTLRGTDASSFRIDRSSGQLLTYAALNFEDKDRYTVEVVATDTTSRSDTVTVHIVVNNIDEDGTVILSPIRPQLDNAVTARVDDPDGNISNEMWTWERSPDKNTWTTISGAVSASYTPRADDFEKYLRATATYTDGEGADKNANGISSHAVVAGPNRPPSFTSSGTQTREVAENTGAGENIGDPMSASDPNSIDTLTYSLSGRDAANFDIVTTSGQLQTKATLDYEAKSRHSVTVSVRDSKNSRGNPDTAADASISVTIQITNVEEAGAVTLPTDQPFVDTALTATLEDPDGGLSSITWQWASSNTAQGAYTNISGATSASYTPVPVDVDKFLRATAAYTDRLGSGKSANAVSANAVKQPNRTPEFPDQDSNTPGVQTAQTRTVDENTSAGVDIGDPVAATDQDTSDVLTYSLGGTDAASFAIVTTSGQLQTKAALDYETKNSYTVAVTATDQSDASATITVTISVNDLDEAGAVTLSSEWPRVGAPFTATLEEPDVPVTGVTWVWESSSDKNAWTAISGATSVTYTPVAADVGNYLRATVSYTDKFASGKSAQAVSVNIVAVNTDPAFPDQDPNTPGIQGDQTREVGENTPSGRNIGAPVAANDPDNGDSLTYTLGGTDAASFGIVASSGQLQTGAALDFEAKDTYTVTVTATDTASASDTITVTITVTDVNEPPGKPDAPTVISAPTNGHNTLSVSWSAPTNTGPDITGYNLQYREGTSGSWTNGPQGVTGTSAQISGLNPSTEHEVQVQATNDEGSGSWSEPGSGSTGSSVDSRVGPPLVPQTPVVDNKAAGGGGGGFYGGGGGAVPLPSLNTPALGLRPGTLSFSAAKDGENPADLWMAVWNREIGGMDFEVSGDEDWLSLTPVSGASNGPANKKLIRVSADISGLEVGSYTATIEVSGSTASNSPQEISVSLTVTEPVTSADSDEDPDDLPTIIETDDGMIRVVIQPDSASGIIDVEVERLEDDDPGSSPPDQEGVVLAGEVDSPSDSGENPQPTNYSPDAEIWMRLTEDQKSECESGGAKVYRVDGETWNALERRCETDDDGNVWAVSTMTHFGDYAMTLPDSTEDSSITEVRETNTGITATNVAWRSWLPDLPLPERMPCRLLVISDLPLPGMESCQLLVVPDLPPQDPSSPEEEACQLPIATEQTRPATESCQSPVVSVQPTPEEESCQQVTNLQESRSKSGASTPKCIIKATSVVSASVPFPTPAFGQGMSLDDGSDPQPTQTPASEAEASAGTEVVTTAPAPLLSENRGTWIPHYVATAVLAALALLLIFLLGDYRRQRMAKTVGP